MADLGATYSSDFHAVFVVTSLETRIAMLAHKNEVISDFRDKLCKEHEQTFPEVGKINISALKVQHGDFLYRLPDDTNMHMVFKGIGTENWFLYVDAARVGKGELVAIMAADQKEIADEHTTLEQGLETKLVEKITKKKKRDRSNDKESRKKLVNLNEPAIVDQSRELCGKVQVEVAIAESLAGDKIDDIFDGAIVQDTESGGKSMGEHQQTSDADQEKSITSNVPSEKLDDPIEQDVRNGVKTAGVDKEKELAPTLELVHVTESLEACARVHITSRDDVTESHKAGAELQVGDDLEKDIGSGLGLGAANILQNGESQLEASSSTTIGPATEKKNSNDDINQSTDSASIKIVNEINEIPENDMGEKSVEDVETDNLASYAASQLEDNTGLTIHPVSEKKKKKKKRSKDQSIDATTEKKRRKKKSSKDHINQPTASAAAATTASLEAVVNENEKVSDRVDAEN